MGWTVRGSNLSGGEILRTLPDWDWGPHRLLYDGYRVSFPGIKRPGRGVDHPPPSNAEVKERVELNSCKKTQLNTLRTGDADLRF
jgi:hypothetical protein